MTTSEVCEMITEGLVGLDLNMVSCRTFAKSGVHSADQGLVFRFIDRNGTPREFNITVTERIRD